MSAHTMYITTCNICDKIGNILCRIGSYTLGVVESAGRARAAAALSEMGKHEEARYLMMGDNNDTKN